MNSFLPIWSVEQTPSSFFILTESIANMPSPDSIDPRLLAIFQEYAAKNQIHDLKDQFELLAQESLTTPLLTSIKESLLTKSTEISHQDFIPESNEYQNYTSSNTLVVDAFLYSDSEIPDDTPSHICVDCSSTRVEPLNYISHSASIEQLFWIFHTGIKHFSKIDCILDVGSRLGSVLWAAHEFTSASRIIGVEIDFKYHEIQDSIRNEFKLNDRIQLFNTDISSIKGVELLQEANLVVFNNVFQFFTKSDEIQRIWGVIKKSLKSGTGVIALPTLALQFQESNVDIDVEEWMQVLCEIDNDDDSSIGVYRVK